MFHIGAKSSVKIYCVWLYISRFYDENCLTEQKSAGVPGNRKIITWNVLVFITQSNPIYSCPEFRSKTTKTKEQSKHFSNFQPTLAIEFQNIFVLEHFNFHSTNGDICICLFCNNSEMDSKIARFAWTLVIALINQSRYFLFCLKYIQTFY